MIFFPSVSFPDDPTLIIRYYHYGLRGENRPLKGVV